MKTDLVFVTRDGCVNTPDMLNNLDDALRALGLGLDYPVVSGSRGKLPSPSSHRTGLVGLTSGSSGRRGRRKVLRPVRRQHRCPQLFQRECHLRRSDDAVHVTVLELQ